MEKMCLLCFVPQKERCAGKKMCSGTYHAMCRVPMSNGTPARRIYLVYLLSNVRSSLFESVFLLVCLHKCWSCELTGLFPFCWESVFCQCACISVGHVNAYGAFPLCWGMYSMVVWHCGCLIFGSTLVLVARKCGTGDNRLIFRNSFATCPYSHMLGMNVLNEGVFFSFKLVKTQTFGVKG